MLSKSNLTQGSKVVVKTFLDLKCCVTEPKLQIFDENLPCKQISES